MADGGWLDAAFLATWLAASVRLAGPVLLAALGELFAERGGVLNLGIEGTLLLGALAAYLGAASTGSPAWGLLAALVTGLATGLLLSWLYVTVQASQVVVGIVFNLLAFGVASLVYRMASDAGLGGTAPMIGPLEIPGLSTLPLIGPALFGQPLMLYLTLGLALVATPLLFRTRFGLALRAVGENPRAAEAAGIGVARMRYAGVLISGAGAALAGAYLMLCDVGLFRDNIVSGQGFIALAVVILGAWKPGRVVAAALLFGAADALQLSLQLRGWGLPPQVLLALPYVLTLVVVSGVLGGRRRQPAALLQPYER